MRLKVTFWDGDVEHIDGVTERHLTAGVLTAWQGDRQLTRDNVRSAFATTD